MTLLYVYKNVEKVMQIIQSVDLNTNDLRVKAQNQKAIMDAYKELDKFKDDIVREQIKAKQRANKEK